MLKNYIKIAWRNLLKNKAHTFINVTGLAVGIGVAMLIGIWIWDELNYDKYHDNYDNVVQVLQHQTINGTTGTQNAVPMPLGTLFRSDYKDVFKNVALASWPSNYTVTFGDKKLLAQGNYIQAEITEILSLKMVKGNRDGLKDPSSIIISQRLAKSLFGDADPMFKMLKLNNKYAVKVSGVYEDMPSNTSLHDLELIAPWDLYITTEPWLKRAATQWGNNSFQVFAQLKDGVDVDKFNKQIKNIRMKYLKEQGDLVGASFKPAVFLHPMSKWHLYSEFKDGVNTGGNIQFVKMFGLIGIFVLLLACINFMNLSTARSEKRAKEVGIRKTVGSLRAQLIVQFLSEAILISLIAFMFSLVIVMMVLPWFNLVAGKQLTLPWANPLFWILSLGFSLFTGLVAGSYPAFYLSSFQPVKVLKGTFKAGRFAALPRKILVVAQFTVSVTLIIGTLVVFRQVQFTKDRPVGYERTGLVQVYIYTDDIHKHFDAVRDELIQKHVITDMAESMSPMTSIFSNQSGYNWRGKTAAMQDDFAFITVSPTYGHTAGWKIIEGRDFIPGKASDSTAVIINEASAKFMGFKHAVGEIISNDDVKLTVIGVVKDMIMTSPYLPVKTALFVPMNYPGNIIIRLNPKMGTHDALAAVEAKFKEYDPGSPFDYKFTDEEYAQKFATEERTGKLAGFFTILAIFISCMGLFGMASFMAEQRSKELGIRKVLGATVFNLWVLMSTDFILLVVISIAIAVPIGYYNMGDWLQKYQYHAELSWWIFALTAAGAISITLLTVSYQSIKAALINPVKSLKSE
ncbi:ABC transporter permease [Mucilaginibacter sp. JRF]|uniref:ABC transporter permease n=1 Tax=Mucilaginibacter sp. JRF TaxID=2780088 RepID=UPI0018824EB5|nr:ABC transporter permease [Mucilaginibacter sp. JRF]MBE9585698.1 ABC transporter permease [Mucilaginibacter sp. JRF]